MKALAEIQSAHLMDAKICANNAARHDLTKEEREEYTAKASAHRIVASLVARYIEQHKAGK